MVIERKGNVIQVLGDVICLEDIAALEKFNSGHVNIILKNKYKLEYDAEGSSLFTPGDYQRLASIFVEYKNESLNNEI